MSLARSVIVIAGLGVLGLGAGVGVRLAVEFPAAASLRGAVEPAAPEAAPPPPPPPLYQLLFVGDIMLDRGVRYYVDRVGNGDFRFPFERIATLTRGADVAFGNLEGPLSDRGREAGNLYSFRMPTSSLEGLTYAGFDVLSLANNHIGDWGFEALHDTAARLVAAGIAPVGVTAPAASSTAFLTVGDAKVAFLAFADFEPQYRGQKAAPFISFAEEEAVRSAIRAARESADLVAAAFHWGDEYLKDPNARQEKLAHLAVDAGADLVVGSHPHILQPLEEYRGKYIAYSLGNFVFDQNFSADTMTGGALSATVVGKVITDVELRPVRLNTHYQPTLE